MKILAINCGSSSLKADLVDAATSSILWSQRISEIGGSICPDHTSAITRIIFELKENGKISMVEAVGHRFVHGGSRFTKATFITQEVLVELEAQEKLAPLHNATSLGAMHEFTRLLSQIPQVVCFDTAFHHTLPEVVYRYGLPDTVVADGSVRKYGFHGLSFQSVLRQYARIKKVQSESSNLIILHLGNGASMCAVRNGASVDTTMGMTPLDGLLMGTRSGSIDPAVIFYLQRNGWSIEDIEMLLNSQSGLSGISGISNDWQQICEAASSGNSRAALACDIFVYRVRHYLGAYLLLLGEVDAIIFTGGIGENSHFARAKILDGLETFGIELEPQRNTRPGSYPCALSKGGAKIELWVMHSDESLEIAEESFVCLRGMETYN